MFDINDHRAARRTAGLCIECGAEASGRSRCGSCRTKNAEARRRRVDALRKAGRCLGCNSADAGEGRTYCEACLPRANEACRRAYRKKRANGKCWICGGEAGRRSRCEACRAKGNSQSSDLRLWRKAAGLCRDCGQDAQLKDRTAKRVSYYCRVCYMKVLARGVLGTAKKWCVLLEKLDQYGWRCAYTGDPLILGENLSFDHSDPVCRFPERRHDPDNVEPVTLQVNLIKRDLTRGEFLDLVDRIHSQGKRKV